MSISGRYVISAALYAPGYAVLILQRTARKLRLSKMKHYKYYDSGFLMIFYFISVLWGCNFIIKEGYLTNWTILWEGFPHDLMQ